MPVNYGLYNLTNSQLVPTRNMFPFKEYQDVVNQRTDLYLQGMTNILDQRNLAATAKANPEDQGLLDQLKSGVIAKVDAWQKEGNLEDRVPEIMQEAYKFRAQAGQLKQLYDSRTMDLAQKRQLVDAGKWQKSDYDRYAKASSLSYKGAKLDPITGGVIGEYTGLPTAERPDIPKLSDEIFKNRVTWKHGGTANDYRIETQPDGSVVVKKWNTNQVMETFTRDDVDNLIATGLDASREVQNWLDYTRSIGGLASNIPVTKEFLRKNADDIQNKYNGDVKAMIADMEVKNERDELLRKARNYTQAKYYQHDKMVQGSFDVSVQGGSSRRSGSELPNDSGLVTAAGSPYIAAGDGNKSVWANLEDLKARQKEMIKSGTNSGAAYEALEKRISSYQAAVNRQYNTVLRKDMGTTGTNKSYEEIMSSIDNAKSGKELEEIVKSIPGLVSVAAVTINSGSAYNSGTAKLPTTYTFKYGPKQEGRRPGDPSFPDLSGNGDMKLSDFKQAIKNGLEKGLSERVGDYRPLQTTMSGVSLLSPEVKKFNEAVQSAIDGNEGTFGNYDLTPSGRLVISGDKGVRLGKPLMYYPATAAAVAGLGNGFDDESVGLVKRQVLDSKGNPVPDKFKYTLITDPAINFKSILTRATANEVIGSEGARDPYETSMRDLYNRLTIGVDLQRLVPFERKELGEGFSVERQPNGLYRIVDKSEQTALLPQSTVDNSGKVVTMDPLPAEDLTESKILEILKYKPR